MSLGDTLLLLKMLLVQLKGFIRAVLHCSGSKKVSQFLIKHREHWVFSSAAFFFEQTTLLINIVWLGINYVEGDLNVRY